MAHKTGDSEELKTDSPLSEKDEVKAAEERTVKAHKRATGGTGGAKRTK
ncbi:hypothetical protein ABZR88_11900 [Mucilaginibacter yixingensis]